MVKVDGRSNVDGLLSQSQRSSPEVDGHATKADDPVSKWTVPLVKSGHPFSDFCSSNGFQSVESNVYQEKYSN